MKHSKLFLLALFSLGVTLSSYASIADCDATEPAVHCAYTSGTEDGFILVKVILNREVELDCLPSTFAVTIGQDEASTQNLGRNFWSFQQCTNQDCSTTMPILTDSFILTLKNGIYKASPRTFGFNVDMSKGVTCVPPCPGCAHKFIKMKK